MIDAWKDYNKRVQEIETYFEFAMKTINDKSKQDSLVSMLKSNLFLMLYNLLESTVRNAIVDII